MKTHQIKINCTIIVFILSLLIIAGCKKSTENSSPDPIDTISDSISIIKEKIIGSWTGDSLIEGRFQYSDDLKFRLTEYNFLSNQRCIRLYKLYPPKKDTLDWNVSYDTVYSIYKISLLSMQQVIQNIYIKTISENLITTPYMNCFDYKSPDNYNISISYKRATNQPIINYNIYTLKKELIGRWIVEVLKAQSPNYAVGLSYRRYAFEKTCKGSIGILNYMPLDTFQWTIVQDTLLNYPLIFLKCINKAHNCWYTGDIPIETMNDSTIITQYTNYKLKLKKIP